MARKTKTVVIENDAENRDKGKIFLLTEAPALKAERWGIRAVLALANAGAEIPDDAIAGGMATMAVAGLEALRQLEYEDARPLLDEMLDCVQIASDPKHPNITRPLVRSEGDGDDIEELSTLLLLRQEVFNLHVDFFLRGRLSKTS